MMTLGSIWRATDLVTARQDLSVAQLAPQAGRAGFFDDAGYPVSAGWGTIDFTNLGDANACAFKICDDSMEPVYREGDIVIVFPNVAILPGDRVVARLPEMKFLRRSWSRRP